MSNFNLTINMNTGVLDIIFKSGYNKAMKENDKLIFEFAKWLGDTMYYFNRETNTWDALDSDLELTDQEIYNLFLTDKSTKEI